MTGGPSGVALPGACGDRTGRGTDRRFALLGLAVVLFIGNVVAFYPGLLDNDALNQYREAKSGQFTDWHPPIMSVVWSWFIAISDGPQTMLALQLALHWLGFWAVADGLWLQGRRRSAWIVLAAGFFPMFPVFNREILKDVHMASAFIAAFGLVYRDRIAHGRARMGVLGCALVLAIYGVLVRANAVFAFGPLLVYLTATAGRLRWLAAVLASLAISAVAIPVSSTVNRQVIGASDTGLMLSLQIFDLAGIARHSGDPAPFREATGLDLAAVQRCHTAYWWDEFSAWGHCASAFDHAKSLVGPDGRSRVGTVWLAAIAKHPFAWAEHRLRHFNSSAYFLVPAKHFRYAQPRSSPSADPAVATTPRLIATNLVAMNFILWPMTWLVAGGMALMLLSGAPRDEGGAWASRMLIVSGLFYSLAYAVIGVATGMRYHYWSEMAILVALMVSAPALAKRIARFDFLAVASLATIAAVIVFGTLFRVADWRFLL